MNCSDGDGKCPGFMLLKVEMGFCNFFKAGKGILGCGVGNNLSGGEGLYSGVVVF